MGKRGPKPTPTLVLMARGSRRAEARVDEPKAPATKPTCPKGKSPAWRACWRWLTEQLDQMRLLSTAEDKDIRRYCDAHVYYEEACRKLDKHGLMVELTDGEGRLVEVRKNPMILERARFSAELTRLSAVFGLNPASRVGMKVGPPTSSSKSPESGGGASRFFARA